MVTPRVFNAKWRSAEIQRALMKEYGGRGPQYEILVRRVAYAEMSAERMEVSGEVVPVRTWQQANKAVLDAVAALQKYTESQKSEMIQTAQQRAMLVIMEIAERVIAPKYPEAWANVVEEIERRLPASNDHE